MLRLTESISGRYGLKLNKNKYVAIQMNNDCSIPFENGNPLLTKYKATYLENEINREVHIKHKVLNKIQDIRRI